MRRARAGSAQCDAREPGQMGNEISDGGKDHRATAHKGTGPWLNSCAVSAGSLNRPISLDRIVARRTP